MYECDQPTFPRHIHAYLDGLCLTCGEKCVHEFVSTPLVHPKTFRRMFECKYCPIGEWR